MHRKLPESFLLIVLKNVLVFVLPRAKSPVTSESKQTPEIKFDQIFQVSPLTLFWELLVTGV